MYPVVILMSFLYSTHVHGDNYLISHPFYSGSHVLTLHHVAEALVSRGHKVCIISIIYLTTIYITTFIITYNYDLRVLQIEILLFSMNNDYYFTHILRWLLFVFKILMNLN